MTTMLQQRKIVAAALAAYSYHNTDGELWAVDVIQKGYRPIEVIDENLKLDNPRIMVLSIAHEEVIATRNTKQVTEYIRCYLESMLEPTDSEAVDEMLHLLTQMLGVCSGLNNWLRTTPILDEHNLPFMFHVMREKAFFQAVVHPTYMRTVDRNRRP